MAVSGLRQDCGLGGGIRGGIPGAGVDRRVHTAGGTAPRSAVPHHGDCPAPVTPPAALCLAILPGQVAARSEEEPEGRGKGCVAIPTG